MSKKTFSQIRLEQSINMIVDENKPIKEISIRCPYCGDSVKNPLSTHLGIKFGHPGVWHCFRCNAKGVVNVRFLKDVGIDNTIIRKFTIHQRKNIYRSTPIIKEISFSSSEKEYNYEYVQNKQLEYLENRFDKKFTEDDLKRYKVILNPSKFIWENNIKTKFKLHDYIGFLTQDNKQAIFRRVDNNKEYRYHNLIIEKTDYRKLYLIDNPVDLKAKNFNFVLTEGVFDLIGVYEHFYKDKDINLDNYLFMAVLGKSFKEPINRLIQSGFLNFNIIIYADSSDDIGIDFYNDLFDNDYVEEILIVKNVKEGQKDFGVSSDKIEPERLVLNRRILKNMNSKNKKKG